MNSRTFALVLVAATAATSVAHATPGSFPGESSPGPDAGAVALMVGLPGALALGLASADVVFAAHGELAPTGLAVTEIVGGSLLTLVCPLFAFVSAWGGDDAVAISNLVFTGVGAGLVTHGIASLVVGGPEPETSVDLAGVSIVPTAGGVSGSLAFRF